MAEEHGFRITVGHVTGMKFDVEFDWPDVPGLRMDEPEPLGEASGPNASRLMAAAIANCLSASLLYCLQKQAPTPGGVTAVAEGRMVRNARGRLRIGAIDVTLSLAGETAESARLGRCLDLFEDFCVVTASVREGFEVNVSVQGPDGRALKAGAV